MVEQQFDTIFASPSAVQAADRSVAPEPQAPRPKGEL